LVRFLGDFELAEEAAAQAFAIAAGQALASGLRRIDGSLVAAARNCAIDRIRRQRTPTAKTPLSSTFREVTVDEFDDAVMRMSWSRSRTRRRTA
jgi:RNA polymerase sigma-70 factor, ECF subfamily